MPIILHNSSMVFILVARIFISGYFISGHFHISVTSSQIISQTAIGFYSEKFESLTKGFTQNLRIVYANLDFIIIHFKVSNFGALV